MIGKRRSGAVAAISELIQIDLSSLLLLIGTGIIAGSIALVIGMQMAQFFPRLMKEVNYLKLNCCIILFITGAVLVLSGPLGLLVLAASTAIGLVAHLSKVRKMHLMGVLIVPTALWFLGVTG